MQKILSIIIPTFNEGNNVSLIVDKIKKALLNTQCLYEIIFIDDSTDDTPLFLENLTKMHKDVFYVYRKLNTGLATAVIDGFQQSCGEYLVVMDADLQHPPELLPVILQKLGSGFDFVIPSRFISGGSDGGLSIWRKLVSLIARLLGWVSLKELRGIRDCTSGFFGIHKSVITGKKLEPLSWKIMIEILVKCDYKNRIEIPYSFSPRHSGVTKLCGREHINYIKHLASLASRSLKS